MYKQQDTKSTVRGAFTLREIDLAQRAVYGGVVGLVLRTALATLFMFLVFLGYRLLGTGGAVFVSLLFLLSTVLPTLVRLGLEYRRQRKADEHEDPADFHGELGHKL